MACPWSMQWPAIICRMMPRTTLALMDHFFVILILNVLDVFCMQVYYTLCWYIDDVSWGIIGFYSEIQRNTVKQNLKNDFFFIFEWKIKNTLHNKKGALCYVYTNFSDFIFIGGYNERKFCKKRKHQLVFILWHSNCHLMRN